MQFYNKLSATIDTYSTDEAKDHYAPIIAQLRNGSAFDAKAALINKSNICPVNEKAIMFLVEITAPTIDSLYTPEYEKFTDKLLTELYGINLQTLILAVQASRHLQTASKVFYVEILGRRFFASGLNFIGGIDYDYFMQLTHPTMINNQKPNRPYAADILAIDGEVIIIDTLCTATSLECIKKRDKYLTPLIMANTVECIANDDDPKMDVNTQIPYQSIALLTDPGKLSTIQELAEASTSESRSNKDDYDCYYYTSAGEIK